MAGCHHPDAQIFGARQAHRGKHVRSTLGHDDQRGVLVGVEVPRGAGLVGAPVARSVGVALQTVLQSFQRRPADRVVFINDLLRLSVHGPARQPD